MPHCNVCIVQDCTVLHCTVCVVFFYCAALHCIVCTVQNCTALYCIAMQCTVCSVPIFTTQNVLYKTVLNCFTLHWTELSALNYTTVHCTALHCTALHCTFFTQYCISPRCTVCTQTWNGFLGENFTRQSVNYDKCTIATKQWKIIIQYYNITILERGSTILLLLLLLLCHASEFWDKVGELWSNCFLLILENLEDSIFCLPNFFLILKKTEKFNLLKILRFFQIPLFF